MEHIRLFSVVSFYVKLFFFAIFREGSQVSAPGKPPLFVGVLPARSLPSVKNASFTKSVNTGTY
jgi:hypothetical protein